MPTGYTYRLIEDEKPLTLRQFTLLCARAFGACVEMRDDDLNKPIPDSFAVSSYHLDELAEAKATLARLTKMTKSQRAAFNKKTRNERIKSISESIAKQAAENKRLYDMRAQVEAWIPAPEVAAVKTFMLEQIDISVSKGDYYDRALEDVKQENHYKAALESAKRDIEYHTEEHAKEVSRINQRNAWLKALRDSLPAK